MTALLLLLSACLFPSTSSTTSPAEPESTPDETGLDTADEQEDENPYSDDPIWDIDSATLPAGPDPCREPLVVRVTYVVDGDTVWVEHADGSGESEKVRFIGVDTPEISHEGEPAECYGDEATAYTEEQLLDQLVWLTFDGGCEDQYNRTLAYVHLSEEETGFYQRNLLRDGYATAYIFHENDTFEDEFETDEEYAESSEAGMWSDCEG